MRSEDTRITYGAQCVWWGGIEDIGKTKPREPGGISLPCCPKCGGMLFELPSPKEWWDGVEKYEANGHPGYRAFIEWRKGKCFPTQEAAKAAYEAKPGRKVTL